MSKRMMKERGTARKDVWFRRRGKFAAATALLLCLCTAFSGCAGSETATSRQAELRAEAKQYDQAVNEQGIAVDLSENPYYMKEHPEFQYSQPETITYDSEVTGTKRHANILLPADYDADRQYPVLYLLHGLDGSHRTWKNKDGHIILQNLTYLYGVPEMIVVFPNSAVNENEDTDGLSLREKVEAYDRTEEDLVTSLMPYINSHYSVKPGRENTAVAGNSMGGRNALNTAFRHPELFGYVGAFSSARVLGDPDSSGQSAMAPLIREFTVDPSAGNFEMLMLCVGRQDDVCGAETYRIHENMTENGVEHIFYDMEGGHQNTVWQNALYNFGLRLFGGTEA